MCGICGFISKGEIDKDLLNKMNNHLIHRGPDEGGVWLDEKEYVHFGHRRLSILDIFGGKQPMSTEEDRFVITFNGEIYNFKELRAELEKLGHEFKTSHSDTEVLLRGYIEWGEKLPIKLNGMWAFAIYDRENKKIFLSRDRFGKKPLFYHYSKGFFAFSSELTSLIAHPRVPASISKKNYKKYFAYGYFPDTTTPYTGVYKLAPAHNLTYHLFSERLNLKRYWQYKNHPFDICFKHPEREWSETILSLLDKAVKRRMISDVPIGVFLSGGLDSSAVAYFAKQHNPEIKTFSVGFNEKSFDETPYAKEAAQYINTDHTIFHLSIDNVKSIIHEVLSRLDEPITDSSILPSYLLCKETKKHVTVALGGDGADELFAGYDPFRAIEFANLYTKIIPGPVHDAIKFLAGCLPVSHANMSFDFKLNYALRPLGLPNKYWAPVWLGPLAPDEITELFEEPTDIEEVYEEAILCWDQTEGEGSQEKLINFYMNYYLPNDILVKIDRASMLNSLEVRSPFLDKDLVEFIQKIPVAYKYNSKEKKTKYILKKALESVLPKSLIYRSKQGFGIPLGEWILNNTISPNPNTLPGFINKKWTEDMSRKHRLAKINMRSFLWSIAVINHFNGDNR